MITHMLHVWNIYQHLPHKWASFFGKYTIHGAYGLSFTKQVSFWLCHPSPYGIIYVFSCFRCRPAPATVFQRRVADVENAQDIQHLGILVSLTRAHIAWGMRNKQRQLTREIYGNIIAKNIPKWDEQEQGMPRLLDHHKIILGKHVAS